MQNADIRSNNYSKRSSLFDNWKENIRIMFKIV